MARADVTHSHTSHGTQSITLTLDELIGLRSSMTGPDKRLTGNSSWAGRLRGPRRGQGMDFDDLRPYVIGDDVRHIDWKVSARFGITHSRLYREEKEHTVTVVLDLRDAMFTGSTSLRARTAARCAARRLWQAAASGSRVCIAIAVQESMAVSARSVGERGALAGCALIAEHFTSRMKSLEAEYQQGLQTTQLRATSLDTIVDRCLVEGRQLGSVDVISGLDDVYLHDEQGTLASLRRLRLRAATTLFWIRDPIEYNSLPNDNYHYRISQNIPAPGGAERHISIDRNRQQYLSKRQDAQRDVIASICQQTQIEIVAVDSDVESEMDANVLR